MNNYDRLKQYLSKASFSSEVDRQSALESLEGLLEDVDNAAHDWASYVEVDSAPCTLPVYMKQRVKGE